MKSEPLSVMIVESQPITRAALSTIFSAEGINVIASLAESRRILQVALILDPDLILFSLNMPNFDEMLRIMILRRELPNTRILVLVSGEFKGQESTAINYGAHQVLNKSIHRNELLDTVRALTTN